MNRFYVILHNGKIKMQHVSSREPIGIIIAKINKPYNSYWINIVKKYFEKNPHHYMMNVLIGE